jgi:hypothetical protein
MINEMEISTGGESERPVCPRNFRLSTKLCTQRHSRGMALQRLMCAHLYTTTSLG